MDGELLAEYGQGMTPVLPSKEYGYRNGELLIVAEAPTSYELVARHSGRCADVVNMWTHNGAPLVQYDCWGGANQHFRIEPVGGGYYRIVAEHSNKGLEIENWSQQGGARVIQWDYVGGQNQQWSIEATDSGYVRLIARHSGQVMEIAGGPGATQNGADIIQWGWWGGSSQQWQLRGVSNSNTVKWLINDHLGTPRMIADGTGSLAGITRKDYLPFGEELTTQGGRSASQGYRSDNTRQQFTSQIRDAETGLDFFNSRYYAGVQGRFTSPDSFGGRSTNPQTLNLYSYVMNNPLKWIDPTGHMAQDPFKTTKGVDQDGNPIVEPLPGDEGSDENPIKVDNYVPPASRGVGSDVPGYTPPSVAESALDFVPVLGFFKDSLRAQSQGRFGAAMGWFVAAAVDGASLGRGTLIRQGARLAAREAAERAIVREAVEEADVAATRYVYRGLAEGEDVASGIAARSPNAGNSPISHVAGQRQSEWISTTIYENVAREKYGQFGVARIDIGLVNNSVVDFSRGIPGSRGMLSNWARKDGEVLIRNSIPAQAVRRVP